VDSRSAQAYNLLARLYQLAHEPAKAEAALNQAKSLEHLEVAKPQSETGESATALPSD